MHICLYIYTYASTYCSENKSKYSENINNIFKKNKLIVHSGSVYNFSSKHQVTVILILPKLPLCKKSILFEFS